MTLVKHWRNFINIRNKIPWSNTEEIPSTLGTNNPGQTLKKVHQHSEPISQFSHKSVSELSPGKQTGTAWAKPLGGNVMGKQTPVKLISFSFQLSIHTRFPTTFLENVFLSTGTDSDWVKTVILMRNEAPRWTKNSLICNGTQRW